MTPREFVDKWRSVDQKERSTAQSHFNDLCELLGEPKPHDDDPTGDRYAFERGATKTGGGDGWADVWCKHCFAWEYKGKHKDLDKALAQVKQYASALENPPLLVACDIERIVVTTNWTNTVTVRREIGLNDLLTGVARDYLKRVFRGDDCLRSPETRQELTQKVAREFAALAQELERAGHDPLAAAHFVNRLVFCMFAEDAGLLGEKLFSKLLDAARPHPAEFVALARSLFRAMSRGGRLDFQKVDRFNGGLFEDDAALPLTRAQIDRVRNAALLDWSAIDPSILGTLFERGLDPAKRSQLGAHYTDPENIMRIVEPVVLRPLRGEWEAAKAKIAGYKALAPKKKLLADYLARLRGVTILDPACGSGNFLYLALKGVKDLEHAVLIDAEGLGLGRAFPEIGPEILHGIELSPYAAELARVSIWVGHLQWQIEHGFNVGRNPVLKSLDAIENRDALLAFNQGSSPLGEGREGVDTALPPTKSITEAPWPDAEFIIGNPPFLGGNRIRGELGDAYLDRLFAAYAGRVPQFADLCVYWFEKARAQIELGRSRRAGLIATQAIRGGANRIVLQRIKETGDIFLAWSDLDWVLEGAAVHVSIVGFDDGSEELKTMNGEPSSSINANLETGPDITVARRLAANLNVSFQVPSPKGPFDIEEKFALAFLAQPTVSGKPNSDVVRPVLSATDLAGTNRGLWTLDFGSTAYEDAVFYEAPFEYVVANVKSARESNRVPADAARWWQYARPRTAFRIARKGLGRFLVTPAHSKYRLFVWCDSAVLANQANILFAVDDDDTFGILHSRFHEVWALAQGTQLREKESGFRYTPTTCFETFPFPEPTDAQRAAVGDAAHELNALRETWLAPPEWTEEETLVFPATVGGPWDRWIPTPPLPSGGEGGSAEGGGDKSVKEESFGAVTQVDRGEGLASGSVAEAHYVRRVAKPGAAKMVASRTLTKLYNDRPAWLRHAHEKLDTAVAAAYGLPADLPDAALLAELLRLNLQWVERTSGN